VLRNNFRLQEPKSETNLRDPSGPLSKGIQSSTIPKVNKKVNSVIEKPVAA